MTFGANFTIDKLIDNETEIPGRQTVHANLTDGSAGGAIFGGEMYFTFGSGLELEVDDIIHVTGWVQKARPLPAIVDAPTATAVVESTDTDEASASQA